MEDKLKSSFDKLKSEYVKLQNEYVKLQSEHANLQNEYSENTIIQSMNEMKDRYTKLMQTTVPNFKYKLLSEKYISLVKRVSASCVFIDHILKSLDDIDMVRTNDKNEMTKIKFQLVNIKEIFEDDLSSCINPR
jgi:sugar-specific transcriptional regulator TrmB